MGTQAASFTRKRSLSGSMSVQIPSGTLHLRRAWCERRAYHTRLFFGLGNEACRRGMGVPTSIDGPQRERLRTRPRPAYDAAATIGPTPRGGHGDQTKTRGHSRGRRGRLLAAHGDGRAGDDRRARREPRALPPPYRQCALGSLAEFPSSQGSGCFKPF